MNKKILIGSIFVLVLILLMPSIPAIQQKTIEDKAYSDFIEKLKNVDLEDIEVLDGIRHPILYIWVIFLRDFRWVKSNIIFDIATEPLDIFFEVIHPLLFYGWLLGSIIEWARINFWNDVSDRLGWGWDISLVPDWA